MFYIYGLYSSENSIIRYIGYTSDLEKRIKEHHRDLNRDKVSTHKKKWMSKCVENGHEIRYIVLDVSENKKIICELEKLYISNYNEKENILVNGTLGGDGGCLTQETRKKISTSAKGKVISESHKEKLKSFRLGSKLSEETKNKMSDTHKKIGTKITITDDVRKKYSDRMKGSIGLMTGKKHSRETKEKISNSKKGTISKKRKAILQIDVKTKEVINTFESITSAQNKIGINNIYKCLVGKRKTAGNYEWKYKL